MKRMEGMGGKVRGELPRNLYAFGKHFTEEVFC